MKKSLIVAILCLGLALGWPASQLAQAAPLATCTSAGNGNWTAITWTGCAGGPQAGDDVVIAAGNTVTLDTTTTILSLTVDGTLTYAKNTANTLTVSGAVTINSGGVINVSNGNAAINALNIGGNFTNNGTFTSFGGNPVINTTFNGAGLQTIGGTSTTAFNNLTINSGSRVVFPAPPSSPTVNGTMTVNTGGAVQQTQTVNNGTFNFLQISTNKYLGVDVTTTNNLGSTTVVITTTVSGGCTTTGAVSPPYATRCYLITPTTNGAATVRLYALTATQLNGIGQANLFVYRYAGGWQQLTTNRSTGTSGAYTYAQADTPGFSAFLLGGPTAPTAVTISSLQAQPHATLWLIPSGMVLLLGALLLLVRRRAH